MKKNVLKGSFLGFMMLFATKAMQVHAQAVVPFGCNGSYYVTYGNAATPGSSTSIDKIEYNSGGIKSSYIGTTTTYGFNGADINPVDGFMYGTRYTDFSSVKLLKIDADANVTEVGDLPSTVANTENIYSGCFDINGDYYVGNIAAAGNAGSIYKINVNTAGAVLIGNTAIAPQSGGQLFLVDMAIDPTSGIMYGATSYCCGEGGNNSKALYTISKTTGEATKIAQFHTSSGYMPAGYGLFFAGDGDLFLYGTDANFYYVNKATAEVTSLGGGATYTFADGCGCSYRVSHQLAASASTICLPNAQSTTGFAFTETFINNRGSVINDAAYHLTLDPRFQYSQTADEVKAKLILSGLATDATTVSFSGTNGGTKNVIDITPLTIPYTSRGTKINFVLQTIYTNTPGPSTITVGSRLYNLPAIIGSEDVSDNPLTLTPNDSTKIFLCDGGPLPVSFISVSAAANVQGNVAIQWETAYEADLLNYEVERSTDGIHFTGIAVINTVNSYKYSYTDKKALPAGKIFYRVKSTDRSGKINYTAIVVVNDINKQSVIEVADNPFKDNLQLRFLSAKDQAAEVKIFGTDGRLYKNYTVAVLKGTSVNTLSNTDKLAVGVYAVFVKLSATGEVFSGKIVKQ